MSSSTSPSCPPVTSDDLVDAGVTSGSDSKRWDPINIDPQP